MLEILITLFNFRSLFRLTWNYRIILILIIPLFLPLLLLHFLNKFS